MRNYAHKYYVTSVYYMEQRPVKTILVIVGL